MYRGEVYIADLGETVGSEQGGMRPVLIVQNNIGNRHSHTTIVVPMSARVDKGKLPTHVVMNVEGLDGASLFLCEQIKTISKERIMGRPMAELLPQQMDAVDTALKISLGLGR